MLPHPDTVGVLAAMDHRQALAAAARARRSDELRLSADARAVLTGARRSVARARVVAGLDLVAKALARAAAAALVYWPDSRDGLRPPEHELAARGVRWTNDPVHDRELAREVEAARARRALPVPPAAPLAGASGEWLAA